MILFEKIGSSIPKMKFLILTLFIFFNFLFSYLFSQVTETYVSPGNFTWICPPNVTFLKVQCWGGGGGGGNSANNTISGGQGGGGGAFSESTISVTSGVTYYFQVANGGTGAPAFSTASAIDGGNSWFNISNSPPTNDSWVLAKGGTKGSNNSNFNTVNGGQTTSCFGTIKYSGGNGLGATNSMGQGGGSSAGYNNNGTNASSINGAIAPPGGGNGGNGSSSTTVDGQPGQIPGGGGGGSDDWQSRKGGNGASGQVILSYNFNCSGIPASAISIVTPESGCGTMVLSANGLSSELGLSYQWQHSLNNISFNDIIGATSTTYTAYTNQDKFYRLRTVCAYGDTSYSNSVFYDFTINPAEPAPFSPPLTIDCGQTAFLVSSLGGGDDNSWFSDSLGQFLIGTGISYTTPNLSQPTQFYVASTVQPNYQETIGITLSSELFNLPFDCGNGSIYGSGIVGFNWLDNLPTSVTIMNVLIELSVGSECNPGIKNTTLNGVSQQNFNSTSNCSCTGSSIYSINVQPTDYNIGGINQFRITNASNFGFNNTDPLLPGKYARITVTYELPSPCYSSLTEIPIQISNSTDAGVVSFNQLICENTVPNSLNFSGISGSIQWQLSSDSLNWVDIIGANSSVLDNSQIGSLTFSTYYRVIVTNIGCSPAVSNVIKITVLPLPVVSAGSDQNICIGSSAVLVGSGATNYSWNQSVIDGLAFNPTTTQTYTVTGTDNNNCTNTDQVIVSVSPLSVGGVASNNQSFCSGGTPIALNLSGSVGSIQWQQSIDNISWSNISGATNSTLPSALMGPLTQTTYYRALVTNGVCPFASSNIVTITIAANPIAGTASSSQIICANTQPNNITLIGSLGLIQWQISTNGTTWSNISGANSSILTGAQMGTLTSSRYYRAVLTNSPCASTTSNVILVTVTPISVGGTASNNQTICFNSAPSNISLAGNTGTIQWQSSIDNVSWNNISGATSSILTSAQMGTLTITTYYRAVVTNGVCSPAFSNTITITVNQLTITGTASSSQSICSGTSPANLSLTGNNGSVQWQFSTDGIIWTNISGATSTTLTSAQMGTLTTMRFYRTIVTSYACPSDTSNNVTISIFSLPNVSAGIDKTICLGSPTTLNGSGASTYSWNNGVIDGAPFTPSSTMTYTVIGTDINGCQNSDQVIVNVSPLSVGGTISSNQTICYNTSPSNKILSGYTGIISWQYSNNLISWVTIGGASSPTLTSAQMGVLTTTRYYRVLVTSGACSPVYSDTITVTVSPTSVGGTVSSNQTICSGSTPNDLALSGNVGAIQWQYWTGSIWTNIAGATSTSLTSAQMGALTATRLYRAQVSSSPCAVAYSNTITITVNPISNGGTINSNEQLCLGNAPSDKTLVGFVGSIQWQSSTDNITWTNIPGATTSPLTSAQIGTVTSDQYFRAIVTSGVCTPDTSTIANIIVSTPSVAGTVSSDQTICTGSTPNSLILTGNNGTIQWQQSTNGSTWTNVTGGTTNTLTSAQIGALTSNRYFRCIVTNSPCPSTTSNVILITVNPASFGGNTSANQTICSGSTPVSLTLSSQIGTTIQWQYSLDNSTWINIPGATTTTLASGQMGPLTVTTYYRALVTSGVCPPSASTARTITVQPPSNGGTASSNQSICTGSSPAALTLSGQTGTIQWQVSTNGTTWSNIIGATASTLTSGQMGTLSATRYYRAVVTNGICASTTSNIVTVTVSPLSVAGTVSSNQTICYGNEPNPIILTGNTGSIQWQQSTNGTTWSDILGATSSTLSGPEIGPLTVNTYFRAIVTSGACSAAITNSVLITITPLSVSGTASSNQSICTGSSPSNLSLSGYTGTLQWQISTDGITFTNIASATSSTLSPGILTATKYYRVIVINGICSADTTNTVTITVYPNSVAGTVTNSHSICSGSSPSNLNLTGNVGTIQWQVSTNGSTWSNISGANSTVLTSAQMGILTSVRYYRAVVTSGPCSSVNTNSVTISINSLPTITASIDQSVCQGSSVVISAVGGVSYSWTGGVANNVPFIPTATTTYTVTGTGSNGCQNTDQVVVTVNPLPTVSIINNNPAIICQNTPFTLYSTVTNGSSYQWKRNGSVIAGGAGSTYTGYIAGNYTLTVTSAAGCVTTSAPVTITITPLPNIYAGSDTHICEGESVILSASGGTTYNWTGGVTNDVPFNPTSTETYTVSTTNAEGCSNSDDVSVFVHYPTSSIILTSSFGNYFLNGIEYSESGVYQQTVTNQWGCDSTINLNLTVYHADLAEFINQNIVFYPNPSLDGKFYFSAAVFNNSISCNVFNATGQLIDSFESLPEFIDLSLKEPGIYFIELSSFDWKHTIKAIKNGE